MYTLGANKELSVMCASILCLRAQIIFYACFDRSRKTDLDVMLMNSYELYTYESSKSNALQQSVNYFNWQQTGRQKYFKEQIFIMCLEKTLKNFSEIKNQ
jgi:hypothetical protein